MKKLVIKNRLYLVEESTLIELSINVPRLNIQKMIDITGARLLSKKPIQLNYNHYAGQVFECKIRVRFENISKYLGYDNITNCENWGDYAKLKYEKYNSWSIVHGYVDKAGLYAFGNCSSSHASYTTCYWYANGKVIELNDNKRTECGNKRYLKNNGEWVSNRKY